MSYCILEGPDGSGKSFTAKQLSLAVKLPIYHSGGPPKSPEEFIIRSLKMLETENVIFDRFSIISEMVYGQIMREKRLFTEVWLKQIKFPIVYCRPSVQTILKTHLKTKPHKNKEHIEKVKNNLLEIITAYDLLMDNVNHIKFNRDIHGIEYLVELLRR